MKKLIAITLLTLGTLGGVIGFAGLAKADIFGSSLVGWWNMDSNQIAGTSLTDVSGSGNTGTLVASPTSVVGKLGQALSLNGSTQYVKRSSAFDFTTENFTVSLWVKFNSISGNPATIYKGQYSVNGYYAQVLSDGTAIFITNHVATAELSSTNAGIITTGNWYHLTYIRNGVSGKIYVNGVDRTTTDPTHTTITSSLDDFAIGAYNNGGSAFLDGSIDEVRIYNRALSLNEVQQLYYQSFGNHANAF